MRIRILSDLHLEHHAPPDGLHVSSGNTVDVVVLAGDIGRGADPLRWAHHTFPDVPVLFVAGNHEFYDRHLDATLPALRRASDPIPDGRAAAPERSGIYLLQRRAIQIGDVRFLGCTFWTDFSLFSGRRAEAVAACRANMDDYRRIHLLRAHRRLRPRDTDRHHRTSVNWLRREREAATSARATVIVTHHAPSRQSIDPRYERALTSAAFVADRDALVRELGPTLWIHGHVHASFEYQIGQTRILANPRGHPDENPAFQISRTVEV